MPVSCEKSYLTYKENDADKKGNKAFWHFAPVLSLVLKKLLPRKVKLRIRRIHRENKLEVQNKFRIL